MPVLVIAALAAAAVTITHGATETQTAASAAADPLLDGMEDPQLTIAALHSRVRAEDRDDAWASASERTLQVRYARIPNLLAEGNTVRVICGRSLCEVAAMLPQALTNEQTRKLFEDLQGKRLLDDLNAAGLQSISQGFGRNFVSYWKRKQH